MTVSVTIPTAASIKTRFPEFVDIDDAVVEFSIEEARLEVGTNWTSGYNLAIVYLVAHYVASAVAASASAGTGDEGNIASESIGRLSISYAQSAISNASQDDKSSTSYGRRYVELLGRNFGGPVVV
jgi:hypothetical protein